MVKTLRAWRTERLLSVRRLADLAGSSNKTIVQLENGRQTATFTTIDKISRVLDVEPREVIEFARAIDTRAGITNAADASADPVVGPLAHVCCVSSASVFHTLAQRLLETERYGVTMLVGIAVTPEQITCLLPDVVVLDLDAAPARELLQSMRDERGSLASPIPLVITGRDQQPLDEVGAAMEHGSQTRHIVAPFDRDARALLLAVESMAVPA